MNEEELRHSYHILAQEQIEAEIAPLRQQVQELLDALLPFARAHATYSFGMLWPEGPALTQKE
ncbi:hypothetical protein [Telmatospirillum sp. J64-1]|uniref:hypothetical protein n=1 Tax=Telmatospirillum sp. J64-1 TaxID=2502183 RepID=UPI00115CC28A|nr:hypothetical protein [Telmatospirillum sp. J64-1]